MLGRLAALMCAAICCLVLVACGGKADNNGGSSSQASPAAKGDGETIGLIIDLNAPLADPFSGPVKQGADQAAKDLGVNYEYQSTKDLSNFVPEYTALFRQAMGRKPAAIVIGNYVPDAFDPLIKEASGKGIPVVVMNGGLTTWRANNAIGFVGSSPEGDGTAAGKAAVKADVEHLLCVDHAPVNPALGQRCQAAKAELTAAGGTMDVLNIPVSDSTNPSAVTQDVRGYLSSHSQIDGIFTLGAQIATNAIAAVKAVDKAGKIAIGTLGNSTAGLKQVKSGELTWIIDEQPYLQGYYTVHIAAQYARTKMAPTEAIMTGGLIIDKGNVDEVLAVQEKYPGIRGAN
jgi:simple sugar transport system substrate-binding protein